MKKTIVAIMFLLLLSACSINNKTQFTPFEGAGNTIGLGLSDKSSHRFFNFNIQGTKFTPTIQIVNDYSFKNEFTLLFLVDYKQISIVHNNVSKNKIEISVNEHSKQEFDITLPQLEPGLHDFMVISLRNPDLDSETKNEGIFLSRRASLIVENNYFYPKPNFIDIEIQKNITTKNVPILYPTVKENIGNLSKSMTSINMRDIDNIYFNYFVDKQNQNYVLISILDKQVLDPPMYIRPDSQGLLNIPFKKIIMNPANHKSKLLSVIIKNPYKELDEEQAKSDNITWDATSSDILTIN